MRNRGKYKYPISVWTKKETDKINAMGEKILEDVKIADNLFSDIETRAGSLLAGRPADTVMSKVTHKIIYPYQNFPLRLLPKIHWLEYKNVKFNIEYFLNEGLEDIEAQVFVSEDTKGL